MFTIIIKFYYNFKNEMQNLDLDINIQCTGDSTYIAYESDRDIICKGNGQTNVISRKKEVGKNKTYHEDFEKQERLIELLLTVTLM